MATYHVLLRKQNGTLVGIIGPFGTMESAEKKRDELRRTRPSLKVSVKGPRYKDDSPKYKRGSSPRDIPYRADEDI